MEAIRATVYCAAALWQPFRGACVQRATSASAVLRAYVAHQLATWSAEETTKHDQGNRERDEPTAPTFDPPLDTHFYCN